MIIYFADRQMQVLGLATTTLPDGYVITEDLKTEDVESGVASFTCRVGFNEKNRLALEAMTNAGNYLLRSHDGENEFYTIIDTEIDTKNQDIYIYAEDAGLDLLNEIAGEFEATETQTAEWYINKYILDSGFEIGLNEIPADTTRKLAWEGESTVTARLASIATQFGDYEISYSFDIKGLIITNKYVNIHKKRGRDDGVQLRLNKEIDKIITTKSVANLATAFVCEGGVPEDAEEPITLKGYTYTGEDDDDFFVDTNGLLKSRKANEKWSRYVWNKEPNQLSGYEGYIVRPYSYNTTDQQTLCSHAITELKKVCDMEVNYEIDIKKLPEGVKIGDRVNIIDDGGELYVSTRVLKLETSVVDQEYTATLGEHLIKKSGISQKVIELAAEFAKTSQSAARALAVANNAHTAATAAQAQANVAAQSAIDANAAADEAQKSASAASESAATAEAKALAAEAAVDKVEASVESIQNSVENAEKAAENAELAAELAEAEAAKSATAASNAEADAADAKTAAGEAKTASESAVSKANTAISTAGEATTLAQSASDTAAAAKLDAEQAEKDVAAFGENLETYKQTMEADYARKTDLTETTSHLQAQIAANAGQISSTIQQVTTIDETANDAKEKAEAAQSAAATAQSQADQATADAQTAQTKANEAASAAASAQSEADKAKAAAATAQSVADKAEADLEAAKTDLATVQGRVDATEDEIAAAQQAVVEAQSAADQAKTDAATAAQKAAAAQSTADTAVTNAANAQSAANEAASKANAAQKTADEAKGDASAAQTKANEAATAAANAQTTANTAVTNAATAQAKADAAATEAANAQKAADDADAKAAAAQSDLNTAKQNLADTISRVDATEDEVAAAQQAVVKAQAAADLAEENAQKAQTTADTAKTNAATAQKAADDAKDAADKAQAAADLAKEAADKAQADADALKIRVTTAETDIKQTKESIALCATKTELELLQVGGRNLLCNSTSFYVYSAATGITGEVTEEGYLRIVAASGNENWVSIRLGTNYTAVEDALSEGDVYTISFTMRSPDATTPPKVYIKQGMGYYPMAGQLSSAWSTVYYSGTWKDTNDITPHFGFSGLVGTFEIKNCKIEKGNKATDWTPAPEDVTAEMLAGNELLRGEITEQESRIVETAEGITMKHLENYVDADEYGAFKETTEASLDIENGQLGIAIKKTQENLDTTNEKLEAEITERSKYFDFTDDGLIIRCGATEGMSLALDNDRIEFRKNGKSFGYWDGEKQAFFAETVTANKELQISPFAFKVREEADGSKTLTFSKVGG